MSEKIDNLTTGEWAEIYEILDNDGDLSKSGKVALKALKAIQKQ
ncbi:hypothetical protein LCGC14_0569700 [marine sediment metagenome]|uniref:Uncharacterized protein n=1 Tax=marine sediment metagenome TaxID=412755 RepID=A0A0F9USP3_9ZZZZ